MKIPRDNLSFDKLPEFDNHELIAFFSDQESHLRGFIAVHKRRGNYPCFGATRLWPFPDEVNALRDALRLSRTMSYKSAMAGLPYGGAKAVIIDRTKDRSQRIRLLKEYARKVNNLRGSFITGTDVGLTTRDLYSMRSVSDYFIGFHCNPAELTAQGVFYGIAVALREVYGSDSVEGKSFAIQGAGKVGGELVRLLYGQAKKIYIADIYPDHAASVKKRFPNVEVVSLSVIHKQRVDIFSPCALSDEINPRTVKQLRCVAVVGGANNQLSSPEVGDELFRRGILYAPDYVVNAGGLISVVDEYEHARYSRERALQRVARIKETLKTIFSKSRRDRTSPARIADAMAQQIIERS